MLVYDISGRNTFTNILSWMDSIREHGSPMIKIALVGHKTDLEDERQVSKEEGQKVRRLCVCGGGGGGGMGGESVIGGEEERGCACMCVHVHASQPAL